MDTRVVGAPSHAECADIFTFEGERADNFTLVTLGTQAQAEPP